MDIRYAIFDMDGLLFDSETYYRIAMNAAFEERGLYADQQLFDATIGTSMADTSIILRQIPGYAEVEAEVLLRIDELLLELYDTRGVPFKPGLMQLLDYLRDNGYPIGLATSTVEDITRLVLDKAGIAGYFSALVFGDMVKEGKPAPDIYLMAAKKLDAQPMHCLVLEDSLAGIRAAIAAGMNAVMVPDRVQPDDGARATTLAICQTLADVIPILAGNQA